MHWWIHKHEARPAGVRDPHDDESGLTLIEMLAVVVILGVVAAIAIPAVTSAITQSKVNSTESTLGTLQSALSRYYMDEGSFPPNLTDLTTDLGTTSPQSVAALSGNAATDWNGPYIRASWPMIDSWGNNIFYQPLDGGAGYLLLSGDGQSLSVPSTPATGDVDLNVNGTELAYTAPTDTAGGSVSGTFIYAAGGTGEFVPYSTSPAATTAYVGVGPSKGSLPATLAEALAYESGASTPAITTPVPPVDY